MAKQEMNPLAVSLGLLFIIIAMFLLRSIIVQWSFNRSMPEIFGKNVAKISFEGAMALTILCAVLFTSSTTVVQEVSSSNKK